MNIKRIYFLGLLFLSAFWGADAQNLTPGDVEDFKVTKFIYKKIDNSELNLKVIYPHHFKQGQKLPAIVFFFGGGWFSGSQNQFLPQALELSQRGMITILADYRTSSKFHTTPKECVSDARSAMRYVREHAKEIGVDKHKIAAGGGSAGGHLAAAAAVIDKFDSEEDNKRISAAPDLLVLFNPVIDNGPTYGYGYDRVKDYYKDFSPAHNVKPGIPPTLIMVGSKDNLVSAAMLEEYKKKMTAAKNICKVIFYENQGHGFFNYNRSRDNEYYKKTLNDAILFLQEYGYIK